MVRAISARTVIPTSCAIICAAVAAVSLSFLHGEEHVAVESIFFNGAVYTMKEAMPRVEAIAVGDGRILAIGSSEELLAMAGPATERIDLGGRVVIPGLTDAHAHFVGYAEFLGTVDLIGTGSLSEVQERLRERLSEGTTGHWLLGRGWDQNDWADRGYPDRNALDEVSSDRPIYIKRICGHAAVANSEALRLAGVDEKTADPAGGRIARDTDGRPTGLLFDNAKKLVETAIPPITRDVKKGLMKKAARECLSMGLVGVHEMGIDAEDAALYEELFRAGELPLRITAYYDSEAEELERLLEKGPFDRYGSRFSIVGVKFYADGSLGARSAALLDDYADDPGNRGILVTDQDSLYEGILECQSRGFQAAIHAIGDRGVRVALDVFARVREKHPKRDARHRIEHAQVVSPADMHRFAQLAVIPSMQFIHCTSDMPWAIDRLGPGRIETAYAWRSLLETGCRIPGGSDVPVESIDPFLGMYAAVTRKDAAGKPPGGWNGGQCLTVEEALRAFTVDAAYAVHRDGERGTISAGSLADFVVLSEDLLEIDPGAIPHVRVLMTVLAGEIVFQSDR
jgi:predicted amidohydrolase YtcJ